MDAINEEEDGEKKSFGIKFNTYDYDNKHNMLQNFALLVQKDAMGLNMSDFDKAMLYSLSTSLLENEENNQILKVSQRTTLLGEYFSPSFIKTIIPKENVLLLGMSYLKIETSPQKIYEDLIEMKKKKIISYMDARDTYRIKMNEWNHTVNCFTVSLQEGTRYSDNHLAFDFCDRSVVGKLKSKFNNVVFNEIVCDWFWFPSSWFSRKANMKTLFSEVFIDLAKTGLLKGSIFCPFNVHFVTRIAVNIRILKQYYHIRFLDQSSNAQSTLWKTAENMDPDIVTDLGHKDPLEQDKYCTIETVSAVKGSNDGTEISDSDLISCVNRLLSENVPIIDISEIRTICLEIRR